MPRESMTAKERWLAVLRREKPDRVPMDYRATPEATEKLLAHLGCDKNEMYLRLHIDKPFTVKGRYVGPPLTAGEDVYGLKYRLVDYGSGVYEEPENAPLAEFDFVEEIEAGYSWPSPDWWDYSHIPEDIKGHEDRPVRGGNSEPLRLYKMLRGEMQAFIDLVENPQIVHYCLDRLFDLCYQDALRIYESIPGKVTITGVTEDLGSQSSLLYSPNHIQEFLLPRMGRMMELARQNGAYIYTHSDGAIRDIIPELIKIGTQLLDPIQWRCAGMEREGLKRDFGDKLVFHGGVDNQQTLPFGSVEDVRAEVIDNLRILGEGGGYILGPCHNIQAVGPAENVIALYETGYEHGWVG